VILLVSAKKSRPGKKSEGGRALVTAATLATHVQKPLLKLDRMRAIKPESEFSGSGF